MEKTRTLTAEDKGEEVPCFCSDHLVGMEKGEGRKDDDKDNCCRNAWVVVVEGIGIGDGAAHSESMKERISDERARSKD